MPTACWPISAAAPGIETTDKIGGTPLERIPFKWNRVSILPLAAHCLSGLMACFPLTGNMRFSEAFLWI